MQITINVSGAVDVSKNVQETVQKVFNGVLSRGTRAANELRKVEIEVLSNASPSKPGSPPGVRTGVLRMSWQPTVEGVSRGTKSVTLSPTIRSNVKYAPYLEYGTSRMAARPYMDKIKEKALPRIAAIYREPYL